MMCDCGQRAILFSDGTYGKTCPDCFVDFFRGNACYLCGEPGSARTAGGKFLLCGECFNKNYINGNGNAVSGREYGRQLVRIRDKNTCRMCKKVWEGGRKFDIHHLNGLCGRKSRGYDRTSEMDGLITYCHKCHFGLKHIRQRIGLRSSPRPLKDKIYYAENFQAIAKAQKKLEEKNREKIALTGLPGSSARGVM